MNNLNVTTQVPFLITSRDFPKDPDDLSQVLNRSYLDIATAVNNRTISIYSINRQVVTGENWFLDKGKKYQSMREVFLVTSLAPIPTNINVGTFGGFTDMYGTYTDGTNFYGFLTSTTVAIAGQISFYVAANGSITFLSGAGAPTLTSGMIVLEWNTAT